MMRPNNSKNCICMDAISYRYPGTDRDVLRDFSASFPMGGRIAVLARSGGGKTTLLHLLAGLIKPTCGEIRYPAGPDKPLSFSMVFQEDRLLEYRSVRKNIQLAAGTVSDEYIIETLRKADLAPYADKKISALSGGEKRRCAIVRALLADYDVLLLDEPFTGLDGETKCAMMGLVKDYIGDKTMILVTHDEHETAFFGCEILRL